SSSTTSTSTSSTSSTSTSTSSTSTTSTSTSSTSTTSSSTSSSSTTSSSTSTSSSSTTSTSTSSTSTSSTSTSSSSTTSTSTSSSSTSSTSTSSSSTSTTSTSTSSSSTTSTSSSSTSTSSTSTSSSSTSSTSTSSSSTSTSSTSTSSSTTSSTSTSSSSTSSTSTSSTTSSTTSSSTTSTTSSSTSTSSTSSSTTSSSTTTWTNTTTTTTTTSSSTTSTSTTSSSSTTITITTTTTLSSTTTTTMVEAVALRAIGALDRAEEDVTANLLSALLESLEGEPLVEPLVTTSSTAVGAEVTVTMLTFVAAANTGQSIMQIETVVSDGSFAPQVSVPLAVLDQISGGSSGPVAITTGKLPMQFARDIEAVGAAKARMDLNVSDAEAAPALATQPFSITVYDSNGEPIRGIQLAQPMTLQLAEDANDSIACAFFNQTSFRWSTSGLRRVRPNMGNASTTPSGAPVPLICETDHLSIFSGVIAIPAEDMEGYVEVPFEESNVANGGISPGTGGGDSVQNPGNGGGVDQVVDVVDQVLRCTRAAGIFSADGMNAVGRGAWTSSSSATALFVSLALFGAAAFAAFARDISRNQTKWMGQLMSLSYNDNEQEEEDEEEEKEEKARSLCKYCILVLQGLQAGVDPESLELAILVRTVGSKQGGELTKGKSPLYAAAVKLADIINVSSGYAKATNLFLEANWLARMLLLFPAVHRSLAAGHGSLIYSRTSKVVVIFLKIFFAGALAALFFQSGASGAASPILA
ncbi:unnamed protein product, partial [Symbiodinium microadriaticum]